MRTPVHPRSLQRASLSVVVSALLFCLLLPALSKAQDLGQVNCAHAGDDLYLYSSVATFEIRDTLKCGQQVVITGRFDSYFAVRTATGEIGYVPQSSLLLLKTTPGAKPALPPAAVPTKPADAPSAAASSSQFLVLLDSTAIRMKLGQLLSSSDAQVGDDVSLEVSEDVIVDGFLVVAKGAQAIGVVNEAEPKRALGRGGKLSILIRSVRLADNGQAVLRSGGEGKGSNSTAGMVIPVMHGKDITFPRDMEFVGYVNGNIRLKRENFHPAPEVADAPPSGTVSNVQHP